MTTSTALDLAWEALPATLAQGEVHLRTASLDDWRRRPDVWAVLSPEEWVTAKGYLFLLDRERYVAARAFLRSVLGEYLGVRPERVRLRRAASGKPVLDGEEDLRFSLSHSSGYAVVAVSRGSEVGVDVEEHRRLWDVDRFAERLLSEREAERFRRVPPGERNEWLLRCWTLKEAYLKATGQGITRPMREVEVLLDDEAGPSLLAVGGNEVEAIRWTLLETVPRAGFTCALAAARPHGRVVMPEPVSHGSLAAEPPF